MKKIYMYRLKCLQETIKHALLKQNTLVDTPDYEDKKTYLENLKANLESLQAGIERFIELMDGKRNPAVGVFGCPSRGKSTLLNVLLGVEILPVGPKAGTTRFGTEFVYSNSEGFTVTVTEKNNILPPGLPFKNEEDVNNKLRFLSDSADNKTDPDPPLLVKRG